MATRDSERFRRDEEATVAAAAAATAGEAADAEAVPPTPRSGTMSAGSPPSSSRGAAGPRRSKRVASAMTRRSSSLGEESDADHFASYSSSAAAPRWRLRIDAMGERGGTGSGRRGSGGTALSSSSSSSAATNAGRVVGEEGGEEKEPASPLLSFGVLADIQYAPIPDGFSYGGVPRYYRHALEAAEHAAKHFESEGVELVVNLGDIIDGKCKDVEEVRAEEMNGNGGASSDGEESGASGGRGNPGRDAVMDVLSALGHYTSGPTLHTYGNHELYNLDREELSTLLDIPFVREPCGDLVGYRSHLHGGGKVRFVVVDSYDVAVMGRCETKSAKRREAERLLSLHNPNFPEVENSPEGLNGVKKRYVAFNGGVGQPQLQWLEETLRSAKEAGERVIILSHQPILPGSSSPVCLVWNYNDVLKVLRQYPCTVIAAFSGHAHKGGYKRDDRSGIHFRVFEAVLESPHPRKTYGLVDVHDDRIVVRGMGDCMSAVYDLDHMVPL